MNKFTKQIKILAKNCILEKKEKVTLPLFDLCNNEMLYAQ